MFMHKYTTEELLAVVWTFMARGYAHNANTALYRLFDAGMLSRDEVNFWVK